MDDLDRKFASGNPGKQGILVQIVFLFMRFLDAKSGRVKRYGSVAAGRRACLQTKHA